VLRRNLSDLLQRLSEHTIDLALIPEAEYASSIRSAPVCEDPLFYVPRRSRDTSIDDQAELKNIGADTCVMVPDSCGLARTTRALFASAGVPLHVYGGEAMGYHVLQEWAALDLGSAILPQSRLAPDSHAVPLLRAPGVPAVLTYRVAWHNEYSRGKALAQLLQTFRPGVATTSATARTR
jgi:DNA-binding transcriptional LysR family regulator